MPLNEDFAVFVRLYDERHQITGRLLFIPVAATMLRGLLALSRLQHYLDIPKVFMTLT